MIERCVNKTILNNGLVILSEPMEQVCSISIGIWVRAGSRHEQVEHNGLTHFIEHALFKGTQRRNTRQIALEADMLGGNLDAFTTYEYTAYYLKTLPENLSKSFDLLADLVTQPIFNPMEMEKERSVILEEIKMADDSPEEMVHKFFNSNFWPDHPLGRPIEGTVESLQLFTQDKIVSYYQQIYHPKNIVITAAGRVEHNQIVELANRYFGTLSSPYDVPMESPPLTKFDTHLHKKPGLKQAYIVLGAGCPSLLSEARYTCSILSTILGGGFSSRLFQMVREEHGLAYTIYSSVDAFRDVGCFWIYMTVSDKYVKKAMTLTLQEMRRLKEELLPAEELQIAKDQLKTAILLGLDSVTNRMSSLAQNEILFGRDFSLEEIVNAIEGVSAQDVQQMAEQIFLESNLALTVLTANSRAKITLAC